MKIFIKHTFPVFKHLPYYIQWFKDGAGFKLIMRGCFIMILMGTFRVISHCKGLFSLNIMVERSFCCLFG